VPLSTQLRSLAFAALAVPLLGQAPPKGFEQTDFDIQIGVLPGQLRFDKERFTVAPDSRVKLTLSNTDAMQHNLVLCARGKDVATKVAAATLQLGASASEKHYVPDMDEVLASTKAIFLDQSDTIWFRAPKQPGDYAYVCTLPGHSFTMKGIMHVGSGKEPGGATPISNLRYRVFRGQWQRLPDFSRLTPFREGDLDDGLLQLGPLGARKNFGAVFTGSIEVEKAARYTFWLNSDDGSRVLIDDREVVGYDGVHPASKEQKGTVQLQAGAHQLRVEFFQGGGGQVLQLAFAGPDGVRRKLSTRKAKAARMTPISVHHHPVVMRVHVEGATARTVAVGLPGGMSYCFDAEACCVQFGWAGAYLDVGPDRDGRGGRPCKTLGPRFGVGQVGFPLRRANGDAAPARFRGYRTKGTPSFDLNWNGIDLTWAIAPAPTGVGLRYTFAFAGPLAEAVQFRIDPDGLVVASELGALRDGVLAVPAGTRQFSVDVGNPEAGR